MTEDFDYIMYSGISTILESSSEISEIQQINQDKICQIPRFSASDIAAIAAYHPYRNILEVFEKYLYQDLQSLFLLDTRNLGLEIVLQDDDLIIEKLPVEQRKRMQSVQKIMKKSINDAEKVNGVVETVKDIVLSTKLALQNNKNDLNDIKISEIELKQLENNILGNIRTDYGNHCEEWALNKYESISGYSVIDRNFEMYSMHIQHIKSENILKVSSSPHGYIKFNKEADRRKLMERIQHKSYKLYFFAILGEIMNGMHMYQSVPMSTRPREGVEENKINITKDENIALKSPILVIDRTLTGSPLPLFSIFSSEFNIDDMNEVGKIVTSLVENVVATCTSSSSSITGNMQLPMFPNISNVNNTIDIDVPNYVNILPVSCRLCQFSSDLTSTMRNALYDVCRELKLQFVKCSKVSSTCTCTCLVGTCACDKLINVHVWITSPLPLPPLSTVKKKERTTGTHLNNVDVDYLERKEKTKFLLFEHIHNLDSSVKLLSLEGNINMKTDELKILSPLPIIHNSCNRNVCTSSVIIPTGGFYVIGKVDGISHQLDCSSEDCSQWKSIKVIIELKNRVRGIINPPPFYEQIQVLTYLIMLDCEYGDHVQSISKIEEDKEKSFKTDHHSIDTRNNNNNNNNHNVDGRFHVHRLSRYGPPYFHNDNWFNVVLPRLHLFYETIMKLRTDDGMRYQWLISSDSEKYIMLQSHCAYFDFRVQIQESLSINT